MTIAEMLDCWNNETNEPESMEWREDLTEYQRKLVEIWDEQYDLRIARMVRDGINFSDHSCNPQRDCKSCVFCLDMGETLPFYCEDLSCICESSPYYGSCLPHNGCKYFSEA